MWRVRVWLTCKLFGHDWVGVTWGEVVGLTKQPLWERCCMRCDRTEIYVWDPDTRLWLLQD